jgi:lysozyme
MVRSDDLGSFRFRPVTAGPEPGRVRRPSGWLLLLATMIVSSLPPAVLPAAPAVAPVAAVSMLIDGPDVSSFQHPRGAGINWAKVAREGHEFAIVKATEGTSYVNAWFSRDYTGIRKAGMVRGSYHYAHPRMPIARSALAQARFYVSHIGTAASTRTLPPALDLEETGGLSPAQVTAWAQEFLLDVRALTGRTPIIYTYPWFWKYAVADPGAFTRYPLWMAAYHGRTPDAGATLWQYTAGATVNGIKGRVDMSKLLADPTTWSALSDGSTPTPWPAAAPGGPARVVAAPDVGATTVSWLPPDAGSRRVTSYRVTVSPADGSAAPRSVSVGATSWSARFDGLRRGVAYSVSVLARNAVGAGPASTATVVTQQPTTLAADGPAVVGYHAPAVLHAVLRDVTGAPLAGATVAVASRAHGARSWTARGSVVTDATGAVQRTFTPGRNDDFRFSYAGGVGLAPSAAVLTVAVRKAVAASYAGGVIRGHATPAEPHTLVAAQVLVDGHWVTEALTRESRTGDFALKVAPPTGTSTWRVVVGTTPARAAGFSPLMDISG